MSQTTTSPLFRSARSHALLRPLAAAVMALTLAGCASSVSYSQLDSGLKQQGAMAPVAALPGSALVAVRWPQAITPAAQALLEQTWVVQYNELLTGNPVSIMRSDGVHDSYMGIPALSIYYAAELTRLLSRYVPADAVVLEPQVLDAEDGKLVYRPVVRNRFPVAMVVDLWDPPSPFKRLVWASTATEFSVSTSGLAAPKTCGLLAFKPKDITRPAYDASRCAAMEARDVPHPDAIYGFASETATFDTATPTKATLPFSAEAAVAFPGGHLQFDKRYLEASARDDFDARQALSNDMLDNLARAIADGLGRIDANLATRAALVSYVRQYDAPLAGRLAENTTTTADAARLKLISQLADAERKWVHAQDARVVNQVLDGAYGKSFRATRLAKQKQADKQEMIGWASALAMAGAGLASGAFAGAGAFNAQLGNTMALQATMQYYAQSDQASAAFYNQFGGELAAQDKLIEVTVGGKTLQLQADNRARLYEEAGKLYVSAFAAPAPVERRTTAGKGARATKTASH